MPPIAKKIIALAACVLLAGAAYYGSYFPLRKSRLFIQSLSKLNSVRSLQEMETLLSSVLNANSPVGQEELARNYANTLLNVINQANIDKEAVKRIVTFVNSYFDPIVARGRGMSFGQDIYLLGALHELAFAKTGDPQYLKISEGYFAQGQAISPKRPQYLYGLLDIYRGEGRFEDAKRIADQILAQWPEDPRTQQVRLEILNELTKKR